MQTQSTFTDCGWDFVEIWGIVENHTYPFLRPMIRSPILDHVFYIEIGTGPEYYEPDIPNDLKYEFFLEIATDETVNLIEFETPAGNTFEIPNDVNTQSGSIETWHYVEEGIHWWEYEAEFNDIAELDSYGDGTYTITVHYEGGGQAETTAPFVEPTTGEPIPQPMQEPVLTFPAHNGTTTLPVTFRWKDCNDSNATSIWLSLDKEDTSEVNDINFPVDANSSDPVTLSLGMWEAKFSFDNSYEFNNADGITVNIGKYSESDYRFEIINRTPVILSVTATRSTIIDTETSQLQVYASDPDDGPSPLSYKWIVGPDEGSINDPNIAKPVYTPPDVSSTQTFRLTVQVSDGEYTVPGHVDVTVTDGDSPILFSENFDDGDFAGWTVVDKGNRYAPSKWSASTGELRQTSNIYSTIAHKLGTYMVYDLGYGWTDYRLSLTMRSQDNDNIGVMFRCQDKNNYYRFRWNKQQGFRGLEKCENGNFTTPLAQDTMQYVVGQTYDVEIVAHGTTLKIYIGQTLIFSVTDTSLAQGSIAMYSCGNKGSYFDDIVVENLEGVNQAPAILSVTATPSTIFDKQTCQLQVIADDPDAWPAALTYSWTVQPGEGSLSDTAIANPIYTPPDVSSTQTFRLTVQVSDGEYTVPGQVDVTVTDDDSPILLSENFDDGDFVGWKVVDKGNRYAPSKWSAGTGELVQRSNIYSSSGPKLGTYMVYDLGYGWTDYRLSLTMRSQDNDNIGVMFRCQDENNYYRFRWNKQKAFRGLEKCVNGNFATVPLAADSVGYNVGQTYNIEIVTQGTTLKIYIGQTLIFSVTDSSFAQGSIAMYSCGNKGSYFDDIVVEVLY